MSPSRRRLVELVGAPVLPPPSATKALTRFRDGLLRLRRRAGAPQLTVFDGVHSLLDNRVLGLLDELDVPDHLDRRMTVVELAAATGTKADPLERVLRYAAARGFVKQHRDGRYGPNGVTGILRRDHPSSWRGWVEFAGSGSYWAAFRGLDAVLRSRVELVGGSFFEPGSLPAGRDRYLLLAIIHDWSDDNAVAILTNVGAAMAVNPSAAAIVVEGVLPDRARDAAAVTGDLLMLALADGRERTDAQHRALAERAGLRVARATALSSGFGAYELRPVAAG